MLEKNFICEKVGRLQGFDPRLYPQDSISQGLFLRTECSTFGELKEKLLGQRRLKNTDLKVLFYFGKNLCKNSTDASQEFFINLIQYPIGGRIYLQRILGTSIRRKKLNEKLSRVQSNLLKICERKELFQTDGLIKKTKTDLHRM